MPAFTLPTIDRRRLFAAGAGLLLPARPALAGLWPDSGFTHGVASGDPGHDAVTLWTRHVSPGGGATPLKVEVAQDSGFRRIVGRGEALAGPDSWGTAQARITGLPVGRWLWYRFTAPDGRVSPVGRTRTLPQGRTDALKVAVFSCSNKPFGYFNAYAHAAARDDIDLVLHLGDYIYEYQRGTYPEQPMPGRDIEPANEIVALDDYRQRYASYRVDPALQALHARYPMIAIWDDHEFANDAYDGGAQNHQPSEGDWGARKAAALKAHAEWLPGPEKPWARYDFGDLASIVAIDTRITGRDRQLDLGAALRAGGQAVRDFRDNQLNAASRTLLGAEQEAWVADAFRGAARAGQKWQLLAQQVVMGDILTPKDALSFLAPGADPRGQGYVKAGLAATAAGIAPAMDMWSGYPAARTRLLAAARDADADLIVVSGDSHNAWAFDHSLDGRPVAVEFAGTSVTSPGYEQAMGTDPARVQRALVESSPGLKWCDTSRRGYLTVAFTPEAARTDYVFVQSIATPGIGTSKGQTMTVRRGQRRMTLA